MVFGSASGRGIRVGLFAVAVGAIGFAAASAAPRHAATKNVAVSSLSLASSAITLTGPYSGAPVLVNAQMADGQIRDASDIASLSVANPKIAIVGSDRMLRPVHDGDTVVTARWNGKSSKLTLHVRGMAHAGAPTFLNDVMPVLTRAGCNQGACHGAASGKGGFKLSLLGYDPDSDFDAIVHASGSRRVAPSQPDNSLVLRKPTMRTAHRGGLRFAPNSEEYKIIRAWIAGGMPGPAKKDPSVVKLEVTPAVRTLPIGQTQRILVHAHYSDGSVRDVTEQAVFTASDASVCDVAPDGDTKVMGPGEGAALIRYQSLVAIARIISPYGPAKPVATAGPATTDSARIDKLVDEKLGALGLVPGGVSADSDFLRRISLDLIGELPTPDEARTFLNDKTPNKRDRLIDTLLARPEFVDYWTVKWGDLLRSSRKLLSPKEMFAYHHWIRNAVAENRPWDQMARELVTASGSTYEDGQAEYFRTSSNPQELAENTAQAFLGLRIQCARCHNHPYDKWTQNQYYQMAAFFAQVKSKKGERPQELVIYDSPSGEVSNPRTGQQMHPCALDAPPMPANATEDRREVLADWMTSKHNPFFAKSLVNRLWAHFMGRGLVEPVDDLRPTNPATNEPLFDFLAADFVAHSYDLKYMMRTIVHTAAYQRSALPTVNNARDDRFGSHFLFKRLESEEAMDAVASVTGTPTKFDGFPTGTKAEQLPDSAVPSYFLDLFGRPARAVTCDCERSDDPNLGQVLHLMNGPDVTADIGSKIGRIAKLVAAKAPDKVMVNELYLCAFSRHATPVELKRASAALDAGKDRQKAGEDLMWALLNTKEFLFSH